MKLQQHSKTNQSLMLRCAMMLALIASAIAPLAWGQQAPAAGVPNPGGGPQAPSANLRLQAPQQTAPAPGVGQGAVVPVTGIVPAAPGVQPATGATHPGSGQQAATVNSPLQATQLPASGPGAGQAAVPPPLDGELRVSKNAPGTATQGEMKPGDKTDEYYLGDSVFIHATSGLAEAILNEIEKPGNSPRLTLYLQGVEMSGLKFHYVIPKDQTSATERKQKAVTVRFTLARLSEIQDNRNAWNELLDRRNLHQSLEVAFAAGGGHPWTAGKLRFELTEGSRQEMTVWICGLLFLLVFVGTAWFTNMMQDNGDDKAPYSLGRVQMAFWELLVFFSWVGIYVITGSLEMIPTEVLTLLGISAVTGLGSIVIGNQQEMRERERAALVAERQGIIAARTALVAPAVLTQVQADRLAEVEKLLAALPPSAPTLKQQSKYVRFFTDICSDGYGLSFHRLQVVLWTLALGFVFAAQVLTEISMPVFSSTLLVLMGISNGTYLGFKIPER